MDTQQDKPDEHATKKQKNPKDMSAAEIMAMGRTELEKIGPPIKTHFEAEAYLRSKNIGLSIKNTVDVMMEAARKGYISIIRELELMSFTINCKNSIGENLLHAAAKGGKAYSMHYLLLRGLNGNQKNAYGETPVMHCAEYGSSLSVEILIKSAKVDLSVTNKFGENALHLASRNGHQKICEVLLKKCSSLGNAINQNGKNPMNYAYDNGNQNIITLFKNYGIEQATDTAKDSFDRLVKELIS